MFSYNHQTMSRRGSSQKQSSQPSQRNQSQKANSSQFQQTAQEIIDLDRMVAEVIQYFLIMEQKKFPVKRNDVMKLVPGISAKNFKTVIAQAQTYLDDVFGFLLHEFDEKSGHYVLLNQVIMPENLPHQDLSESNTILFLTLSAIFLSEGCIGEDEVWNMLDILGYKPENHKKLVTSDFVRQLYINLEVIPQSDPPKMNFTWGERATIEFTKKEILAFAAKIYGQPPEQFGTLWNLADKEDKAREAN